MQTPLNEAKNNSSVTIVIPVFNSEKYVSFCLDHIMKIEYPQGSLSIVVVDNGSTDNSVNIIEKYDVLILKEPIANVSKLRNTGASSSKSDFIAFIDSDCCIDKSWLNHGIEILKSDKTIGILGAYYSVSPSASWLEDTWCSFRKNVSGDVSFLSAGNMLMRRNVFNIVGGFSEQLISGEDYELGQKVRKLGYRVVCDPLMKTVHLGNPKSMADLIAKERWYGLGMFDTIKHGELSRPLILVLFVILNVSFLVWGLFFSNTIVWSSLTSLFACIFFVSLYLTRNVVSNKISTILKCLPISVCYIIGRLLSVFDYFSNMLSNKKS